MMKKWTFILVLCLCMSVVFGSVAAGRKTDEGYTTPGDDYTMVVHRVDSDGVSIYGRLYLPLDFDETRTYPLFIFSHGFNNSAEGFDAYAVSVVQNGWIGYSFDFVGGSAVQRRTKGNIRSLSILTQKQNLLDIVADLRTLPYVDASRVVLCGASMGAAVTSLVIGELQDPASAVVLIYPALNLGANLHDQYASKDDIPEKVEMGGIDVNGRFHEELWDLNILESALSYSGPVLMLHGDADTTVPVSVSVEAQPRFEDAELIVVPGANHGASEALREAFEENVFRFLEDKGI
ncbi:MAG: alpha/beta hydrolase [Clostridia bacterium]|nr:alpha/beta hydrolase [Clostridia bacterium]